MQKFDDISGPFFGGGVGGVKVFLSTALPVSKRPKVVCVCVCEALRERVRGREGKYEEGDGPKSNCITGFVRILPLFSRR
jgi:hypothetical protein